MKTRVQKWGNSLAVRLPKSFAESLRLETGSPVEMSLEEGAVVIKPDRDNVWDLDSLLAAVTDENVHPAWDSEEDAAAEIPEDDDGGDA
jgi:antitoxin MazE